jgi:hypothetical protein
MVRWVGQRVDKLLQHYRHETYRGFKLSRPCCRWEGRIKIGLMWDCDVDSFGLIWDCNVDLLGSWDCNVDLFDLWDCDVDSFGLWDCDVDSLGPTWDCDVAQLVETLSYKPEGRGFDSLWCDWNFHWLSTSGTSTQHLSEVSARDVCLGDKCGWCVELTTLLPSCADCLVIWEPHPPGTVRACPGLYRNCFAFYYDQCSHLPWTRPS